MSGGSVPQNRSWRYTPILDKRSGNIFFTLQSGHVGRINMASGEMVIKKTPSDNTYPYGIRLDSQGVPWYVDFRGPRIGRVDPKTMEIKEYPLPNPDARPRRFPSGGGVPRHFEATAQGSIVTANSGVNKIGIVEIGTLSTNRTN